MAARSKIKVKVLFDILGRAQLDMGEDDVKLALKEARRRIAATGGFLAYSTSDAEDLSGKGQKAKTAQTLKEPLQPG
ncbi:hypothetical protein ElyMa_002522100 [Elysia marginata]|uniref:Uncharacterized protein n=1 Tax=Elysia marginata TaxID=1093978 RepID=A0AAV4GTS3_9GAST|nr:hypothetical protein ElyMa_002522100 [Elysia marginata]